MFNKNNVLNGLICVNFVLGRSTRLYSTQTCKNHVGFVSCSNVVSNFVNLSLNHKGYKYLDPNDKIIISRDVTFDEHTHCFACKTKFVLPNSSFDPNNSLSVSLGGLLEHTFVLSSYYFYMSTAFPVFQLFYLCRVLVIMFIL